jgi:hypothetical protein
MVDFQDKAKNEIWKTLKDLNNTWINGNPDDLKNYLWKYGNSDILL